MEWEAQYPSAWMSLIKMGIAYIISAYKNAGQLVRLVHRLYTGTSMFFIHVDKRAGDEEYREPARSLGQLPNVHFLARHRCYWGGFGHVEVTLKGIRALMVSGSAFDYVVLLTGQDYPIKPVGHIEHMLHGSNGKIYMDYSALPHQGWERGGMDRILYWHVHPFARPCRALARSGHDAQIGGSRRLNVLSLFPIKRRFPAGFKPFGGSSYWCFPRECIEHLYNFLDNHRSFIDFFRYVDVPDEILFQTIILNSPLRDRVVNDDLRFIDWKEPAGSSPAVLGKEDFEAIRSSSKLFARKFDVSVDADILDMIDRDILEVG